MEIDFFMIEDSGFFVLRVGDGEVRGVEEMVLVSTVGWRVEWDSRVILGRLVFFICCCFFGFLVLVGGWSFR